MNFKIDMFDSKGRLRHWDRPWGVYAALAPDGPNTLYVKIGVSCSIWQRALQLRPGCPFQIKLVYFHKVGARGKAAAIECALHHEFARRQTNGEWVRFDRREVKDKAEFQTGCLAVFEKYTGGAPVWQKIRASEITAWAAGK